MDMSSSNDVLRDLVVKNKMGIHARLAAMIVRIANKHIDTEIWVEKASEQVNGKSIMGLMMLAAGEGTKLSFMVKGPSSKLLFNELEELFERCFEEQ